jgi:U4/U6 small nuclear ribonucleoprotein PRP4
VLPAHLNIISDLQVSSSGELLVTTSFDSTIKVWGTRDYRLLQTLKGHEGKVMSCDFSPDEKHIVSAGFDKTIKMWSHKDEY